MNILGLSHLAPAPMGHDSTASLIIDGKVDSAASEERFNRVKHFTGHPASAIDFVLKNAGLRLKDIDYVAVGWDIPWTNSTLVGKVYGLIKPILTKRRKVNYWKTPLEKLNPVFMNHQFTHASSGYRLSGFDKALIISLDGTGVDNKVFTSGGIFVGNHGEIETLKLFPFSSSFGMAYGAFTIASGFIMNDGEGKTMGLSAFGKERLNECFKKVDSIFPKFKGTTPVNKINFNIHLDKTHGCPRSMYENKKVDAIRSEFKPETIAWAAQKALEKNICKLVVSSLEETGLRKLALSGGIFYNVMLNKAIREAVGKNVEIFFNPVCGDQGNALGAGLELYHQKTGKKTITKLDNLYFGPGYNNDEIKAELKKHKYPFKKTNVPSTTSSLLEKGKVVGWFQGKMELGPRALGSRTILANPTEVKYKDIVNNKVKHRESWRPFCPSLIFDKAKDYLVDPIEAPFMILAFDATHPKDFEAVCHIDGTTRPQTVRKDQNKLYYETIKGYGGIVLNTSFNLAGDPIICTPLEAIRTFKYSEMDHLVIGDFLVSKR